jgi:serine/threonine-protein kinase
LHATIAPGDVVLGKYRVERVLGRGGMGLVVSVRHLELGQLYAIKVLLPSALDADNAVERFLREGRESARLVSEHVVRVLDVGRLESGAPFMLMEHLTGHDLRTHLLRRGPLPVERAVVYLLQACEAIIEAHELGIVHRDLKPANLFLSRRADGSTCVKLLDFGISRPISPDAVELTKSGVMVGSPLYMSPEQMVRNRSIDTRSDIWSLGVVLYELVTGVVPFRGTTITEVVARVLQNNHEPPSNVRPGLPDWVDAIVARCLEKKPDRRFQSVREFVEALREPLESTISTRLLQPARANERIDSSEPDHAMPASTRESSRRGAALLSSAPPVAARRTLDATSSDAKRVSPRTALLVLAASLALGLGATTFVLSLRARLAAPGSDAAAPGESVTPERAVPASAILDAGASDAAAAGPSAAPR